MLASTCSRTRRWASMAGSLSWNTPTVALLRDERAVVRKPGRPWTLVTHNDTGHLPVELRTGLPWARLGHGGATRAGAHDDGRGEAAPADGAVRGESHGVGFPGGVLGHR